MTRSDAPELDVSDVEAVAEALWLDRHPDIPWTDAPVMEREDYRGHARAALTTAIGLGWGKNSELRDAIRHDLSYAHGVMAAFASDDPLHKEQMIKVASRRIDEALRARRSLTPPPEPKP